MLFSSAVFLFLFLPCVLAGYYILFRRSRPLQNVFLLMASLLFYAWGEPRFVLVMIASILANYGFGLWVSVCRNKPRTARFAITAMLTVNLGILFVYKYLGFTVRNINLLFASKLSVPAVTLPIGISFFTFQAISYVLDVHRGRGEAQKNPLNVGLYISFFPQLIAGPIVKYETVAHQIRGRRETWEDFTAGVCRFIIGLGKKILLANTLALAVEKAFNLGGGNLSVSFAWMGALAYTFQIYFDFSGYSDMAIGLGRMFGFRFLENFNYPYISRSITEFWRRWHISLSTWFRDYVYFPLGGSRVGSKTRLVFNLFAVWLLTGIWHGANWTFICWGLFYFILIAAEKLTGLEKRFRGHAFPGCVYTMFLVICGWVLFRADSIGAAGEYFKAMFGLQGNGLWDANTVLYALENRWFFAAAVLFSFPIVPKLAPRLEKQPFFSFLYTAALLLLFAVSVSYIIKGSYNPFIYFNF